MKASVAVLLASLTWLPVPGASAQTFAIEKTGDIPLDLGDEFAGQIVDLFKDADGHYYLTDWQQNTIWMVDGEGVLIRRIGREGSGPGELRLPVGAAVSEDNVIVLDKENNRVMIFGGDGTYANSFRCDFPMAFGILVSNNGLVAVSSFWQPTLFTVYDLEGNAVGSHGKREPDTRFFYTLGDQHFSQTPDGHILYSTVKEYPVYRMAWDGTVLATYQADSPGYGPWEYPAGTQIPSAQDLFREMYKTWTPILRPLAVADHTLVQRKKMNFEGPTKYYGDLFTLDGAPVQLALELPMQFYASDNDLLYGIDTTPVDEGEDNPHIVVYRLTDQGSP